MGLQLDPEDAETMALFDTVKTWAGKRVLEVGCGDGRLTWRYADQAASVVGIDPEEDDIAAARRDLPARLRSRITLVAAPIEGFDGPVPKGGFDLVLLAWSL